MEPDSIKRLDVHSLLKRTKIETTEEVLQSSSLSDQGIELQPSSMPIGTQIQSIEYMTKGMSKRKDCLPEGTCNANSEIKDILCKYNEKYGINLEYSTLTDALDLAVTANKYESELTNAIVSNSISAVVDFTMFSMAIQVCNQINGLVSRLLASDDLTDEAKVSLVDRMFLWMNRLQQMKDVYSKMDIDHIVRKYEQNRTRSSGNSQVIEKLLNLLKIGKSKE